MMPSSHEYSNTFYIKRLNYAYHRNDYLHGIYMVLDLTMEQQHSRICTTNTTRTLHRHAYLQQPFGVPNTHLVAERNNATVNIVVPVAGIAAAP